MDLVDGLLGRVRRPGVTSGRVTAAVLAALLSARSAPEIAAALASAAREIDGDGELPEVPLAEAGPDPDAAVAGHLEWAAARGRGAETPHPLLPGYRAAASAARIRQHEVRADRRIWPSMRIREGRPERRRGLALGGLAPGGGSQELPLPGGRAPPIAARKQVPLLDLIDSAGVEVMARGRGAPLALRLHLAAALAVPVEDRRLPSVRIAVSVRELMARMWPRGPGLGPGYRIGRHWPRMRAALEAADGTWMRMQDGGMWRMFALRRLPPENRAGVPAPDGIVLVDVALPPGSSSGPAIDLPALDRLSVSSAPRLRAWLAAQAVAWIPGVTRVPAAGGGPGAWGWSRDVGRYPVLTPRDQSVLAYGPADRKHRTAAERLAAWRDLPGLALLEGQADLERGEAGCRVVPAAVAAANKCADRGDSMCQPGRFNVPTGESGRRSVLVALPLRQRPNTNTNE